ncbi:MAG: hypothetical protein ABII12_08125 [Planctomycetota bacterium]
MAGEQLILQVTDSELRLVLAAVDQRVVTLSDGCTFCAAGKGRSSHPLEDVTLLDAFVDFVAQRGWTGRDLICLAGGEQAAAHYYKMPPVKGAALHQAALLKLGQQLHFDVAEAVVAVDSVTRCNGKEDGDSQILVNVAAIQRGRAWKTVDLAARAKLNLVAISTAPSALAALATNVIEADKGLDACLYLDERASTLIVLNGGNPWVSTELPISLADITTALMRPIIVGDDVVQLEEVDAATLRSEAGIPEPDRRIESLNITGDRLLPLLEPVLQRYTQQLTQWMTFAATSAESGKIERLRIVGPGAAVPRIAETLASRLSRKVEAFDWLSGVAEAASPDLACSVQSYATAVGAARHRETLPDLIPPELRKQRRNRRIRRSIAWCGPFVAAAILGLAVMFGDVGARLLPGLSSRKSQLSNGQRIVDANQKWTAEQQAIAKLQQQFDEFSNATPHWVGLFKELSMLMPEELQVIDCAGKATEGGLIVTVEAAVVPGPDGQDFDQAVENTLLRLDESSFISRVQLLEANRKPNQKLAGATGTLSVELSLAYPGLALRD